ncbi:hypothetical protein E2C01_061930 [Portunus trituberculatus]|uniref:Uncharacterized protein n=1 Tax=Portunus trituberculatus TaxID=210409 RepID=A0A5B7HEK2_PORTR|nr:hypothetical protein [Portunus trituberculatus]
MKKSGWYHVFLAGYTREMCYSRCNVAPRPVTDSTHKSGLLLHAYRGCDSAVNGMPSLLHKGTQKKNKPHNIKI